MKRFAIGGAEAGTRHLLIVAGPCVIESAEMSLRVAAHLKTLCAARDLPYVFKASYAKANRSSAGSFQGLQRQEALEILGRVRREVQVPVLTDVHAENEIDEAARVADALQIPAFLSRQTSLLQSAARSGRAVNVKKGQFLAPDDMRQVVEKLTAAGGQKILLTERGTTFGYHDLVVDMRGLVTMRGLGWPVLYDATHSLQRPGGEVSGGDRRFAVPLMRAAVACGVDGLFFETHPDPSRALSDAAVQLPLAEVEAFLDEALLVHERVRDLGHA
ncbi:MAG: 3-deoxy-8-phosphooctulonate synthase [Candidatus Eisenbacteria bacterium]|uniref:3-deoxy-8-phosphooctulonate synthase n=1 Tax=Eiseniibacteriota bacterium TaxID=2212470 RepID=A0A538U7G9_UNCEI|nr:MAG: 3-deoxy-8-phosphooctulonate synthase [Candidatus Eisenbacteria bacterium]